MKRTTLFVLSLVLAHLVSAQCVLPAIFGDGMVFQRFATVPVWGWGTPGDKVTVQLNGKTKSVKVAKDGTWRVSMPELPVGGPYTLTVTEYSGKFIRDKKTIQCESGDVFLFSGQSNQELFVYRCMDNPEVARIAKTYTNKDIHILKLPQQFNFVSPQTNCKGADWVTVNPETAPMIAALSYFVSKEIQEAAKVPIGIINSSVGGTRVEAWMSRENLLRFPEYQEVLADRKYHQTNWADSVRTITEKAGNEWEAKLAAEEQNPLKQTLNWQPVELFGEFYDKQQSNGSYWFRRVVNLPAASLSSANDSYLLRLGASKDADETYVNGKQVGITYYQYPPRKYQVPANILHEGANEILIHLKSQSGTPFFTEGKLYQLELTDTILSLHDGWQMAVGKTMPPKPGTPYFVDTPTGLYNAMIAPLGNLAIRGMVWYQGEANIGNPYHYKEYLEAMIDQWHGQFRTVTAPDAAPNTAWPSVIVQLAGYMDRHNGIYNSGWCDIRRQQREVTQGQNAYLATAIDCGEWNDIHPQDKPTIAHRVALQLRHAAYGEDIVSEGPSPVSARYDGQDIIVTFSEATGKLRPVTAKCCKLLNDYQILVYANQLSSPDSPFTIQNGELRYAHDDYPLCLIYNTDNLPSPQWEIAIE